MTQPIKVFFDGGCKPNPGKLEVAVVIGERNGIPYHQRLTNGVWGTNNEAEWLALLWAMELAHGRGHEHVIFIGDSRMVVMQARGQWKIKAAHLHGYFDEFQKLKRHFLGINLQWIGRNFNLAGHVIECQN